MSLVNNLKNAGLGDKEAKVYLAMLELGPAPVLEIAAKAGVNRPTAYLQIESLKKMGLVSTQKKGKKDLYIAESPDQLNSVLSKEEKLIGNRKEELKKILPELESVFNQTGDKPVVRYFEGKEGLKKILNEFLKAKDKKIYLISSYNLVYDKMPTDLWSDYSAKRLEKKIFVKAIFSHSGGEARTSDPAKFREIRFIDAHKFPFNADVSIFDDKVAISSVISGKLGGTIVTDKNIADSFMAIFNLLWPLGSETLPK